MARFISATVFGTVIATIGLAAFSTPGHAQNTAIDDIKGKIFDAKMAQQTFAGGLTHCSELNGTNFYFQPRDRVLNIDEYHRSLDNLALQGVFNPATKRPWNQKDADARWAQVQKQAQKDQATCALVASLPDLQKKLQVMQQQTAAPKGDASANKK
ncbi:MAG: hypothetical protein WCA56_24045 [Xanthobacteraceae bacterium]|jgi:hypothetical protein